MIDCYANIVARTDELNLVDKPMSEIQINSGPSLKKLLGLFEYKKLT